MISKIGTKIIFAIFSLLIISLFILPLRAYAQGNLHKGKSIILDKEDIVESNYFAAGEYISLEGTVNGDAYLAGGRIIVKGTVNGDVIAAGGQIDIEGVVNGNIRTAGGQITVTGDVEKNITALGGQIKISKAAKVKGSVTSGGGSIEVNSPIGKGLQAGAGTLTVENSIGGDLTFAGENLYLASDAKINGDVFYYSEKDADISKGASVSGKTIKNNPQVKWKESSKIPSKMASGIFSLWTLFSFLTALILGAIIVKIIPNFSLKVSSRIQSQFWKNLGIGFLLIILTPIVFILLLITVFGAPLAFMLIFAYIITLNISKIFVSLYLGSIFVNRFLSKQKLFVIFVIGLFLYFFIGIIPFVGGIIQFLVSCSAIGALLSEKKQLFHTLYQKKLI